MYYNFVFYSVHYVIITSCIFSAVMFRTLVYNLLYIFFLITALQFTFYILLNALTMLHCCYLAMVKVSSVSRPIVTNLKFVQYTDEFSTFFH